MHRNLELGFGHVLTLFLLTATKRPPPSAGAVLRIEHLTIAAQAKVCAFRALV